MSPLISPPQATVPQATVPSCHSAAAGPQAARGAPVVALVGAPNVGKSTLFNLLTKSGRDTGNWPGTTVEVGRGLWSLPDREVALLDLPGAYSLDPLSPDEEVTRTLLCPPDERDRPDLVAVVVDATALSRSLYLAAQVRECTGRVIGLVTMLDVARARGRRIDVEALGRATGMPFIEVDPRRARGQRSLAEAVTAALDGPPLLPRALCEPAAPQLVVLPDSAQDAPSEPTSGSEPMVDPAVSALELGDERFAWIDTAVASAVHRDRPVGRTGSDRADRILTAPVLGPLAFLATMWMVFQLTTTVAAPLQDLLDRLATGPVTSGALKLLSAVNLDGGLVEGFVVDGLVAGVGMLLTFLPLMAIMFLLLSALEDSGYMARAAVVTDRMMRAVGLPGRAFLPLIVGFGCNVPAVSGARVLPNARHRLLTALLVPFTSCSARLPVYVLLASTFFPGQAGTVVFAMYVISILFVLGAGLLLRSTLLRTMGSEPLILDLPPYHLPLPRAALRSTWTRLRGFLRTAGGVIVATVAVIWALQAIPAGTDDPVGQVPVENSAYAATARAVAPVFAPAGFGDWHTASALVTGFVAKEAVIASWSQTYAAEEPESMNEPGHLGEAVRADFEKASGNHTGPAVWAFMIFLLAYTPCVATLAAQKREIGWRWTGVGVGLQLGLAWTVAVLVFQVGRLFA
ncbi:MAG: ferrous iron transport protein [Actinomycetota bacterium]|nr:ferrous iron transport protein [Actinomycetota bacterium]